MSLGGTNPRVSMLAEALLDRVSLHVVPHSVQVLTSFAGVRVDISGDAARKFRVQQLLYAELGGRGAV